MMKNIRLLFVSVVLFLLGFEASAQSGVVKAKLVDAITEEPLGYATASLTPKNSDKVYKYMLSNEAGEVKFDGVKNGTYTFKAELMGYKLFTQEIILKGTLDLGTLKVEEDRQALDAASVSAVGNPIVIKKDTIEYNATSFKTTENDVLEDLLKKLPGVEVDENGGVTVNGETIKKITIDGKTFFLDDPQLASKNIPAKIVNKVKVVQKKSEQAEFTGIDDGEEETVIDLNIKPGMMKGTFGNVSAGAGHDLLPDGVDGDARYQGAAFVGKFTDKTQLSFILNGNNTNNRAFNDMSRNMMGNMRGGGGMGRGPMGGGTGGNRMGNGITTSYMAGGNAVWDLFDDAMTLGTNYLYNYSGNDVIENGFKTTYLKDADGEDYNRINTTDGTSNSVSQGHRFGVRLEHKFSENTSILFEPQLNFGTGSFIEKNSELIAEDYLANGGRKDISEAVTDNDGSNKNLSASGFALLRQKLGIPGRTLTVMGRYAFSRNNLIGYNRSVTSYFGAEDDLNINQYYDNSQNSNSMFVRATYTEPIGHNFYVEANYSYSWSESTSDKETFNFENGAYSTVKDDEYSNSVKNVSHSQRIGANLMYQRESSRAQIGFSAIPTKTYNKTDQYVYDPGVKWNWSPQAMLWWEFNENANARLFYRGNTSQPSVSKLMSVPDISNPLDVSFGNPYLNPYFSHDISGNFRYSNKKTFSSVAVRFNGGFVQDPIVNAIWYGDNGTQYSMPFNGPTSANASIFSFANITLGQSGFSLTNMCRLGWNKSGYYVGSGVDMSTYDEDGYYAFMDEFLGTEGKDIAEDKRFETNSTNTFSAMERFGFKYTKDAIELQLNGRTRINKSWYRLGDEVTDNTMTFNNQIRAEFTWTWDITGLVLKTECNYNWYNGYTGDNYQPEFVADAEIQKLLFKKKCTLALKGYDIFGQAKNIFVTDESNYHKETYNNTLGRYIVLSFTYRFGNFDKSKMRGPMGGPGMR